MNSMERVLATIAGEPTDRRAVSLTLPLFGARLTGRPLAEHYVDPQAFAEGQSAVLDKFHPDVLFGPFALPFEGAAFGSKVRLFDDQAPNLTHPAIASVDDLEDLQVPDVATHPHLLFIRQAIRLISSAHGKETPVAAIVSGPVDLGAMILGIEEWLKTLLFNSRSANLLLEKTVPFFIRWANTLLSDGAHFIVLPVNFTNPSIVTRRAVIDIAVPAMRVAFSQLNGPVFIHSGGSPLAPFLDLFAELPNVAGFILNGGDDLALARQTVGPKPVLIGNIDGPSLFMRNRMAVLDECKAALLDRQDDPRFILGTSSADVDLHTPFDNVHAFAKAVHETQRGTAC
jgi:uroporphyrinogen decarboxylase